MACFLVPAAEAVLTLAATKIIRKKEIETETDINCRFSEKLGWLNKMLCGGSALLAFEHLWHGEITPFPPFLTAAYDTSETAAMLREMSTSGVAMAVLVTCVWSVITVFSIMKDMHNDDMKSVNAGGKKL